MLLGLRSLSRMCLSEPGHVVARTDTFFLLLFPEQANKSGNETIRRSSAFTGAFTLPGWSFPWVSFVYNLLCGNFLSVFYNPAPVLPGNISIARVANWLIAWVQRFTGFSIRNDHCSPDRETVYILACGRKWRFYLRVFFYITQSIYRRGRIAGVNDPAYLLRDFCHAFSGYLYHKPGWRKELGSLYRLVYIGFFVSFYPGSLL